MSDILTSIINGSAGAITLSAFFVCLAAALILGTAFAYVYSKKSESSKSFVTTLAMLPAIVTVVIMMVNGSVGAGVAVAGAFSLIRFRSAAGTAKEICAIFMSMTLGLACGMGYPLFAMLFTVIMSVVWVISQRVRLGGENSAELARNLNITVPEDLNYSGAFNDLFDRYTTAARLIKVKTTNLGSLNRLTYRISLKEAENEKALIDELRCRNGNLEISTAAPAFDNSAL
ncbi:MAG: DUF4956 domain-containing protein [Lachnospiraceae bacterium]|nr:DUF4956 domain-containing protein [Lachnospiraceae bacterium]